MAGTLLGRRLASALVVLLAVAVPGSARTSDLPSAEDLLGGTPFQPNHIAAVMQGEIAVTEPHVASERELAVGVACLLRGEVEPTSPFAAPKPMLARELVRAWVELDGNGEQALQGLDLGADFDAEARRFVEHAAGLGLNLSRDEVAAFTALRETGRPPTSEIEALVRRLLGKRVQAYRERGLDGIAPYVREDGRDADPAQQLRRSLSEAHRIEERFPEWFAMWNGHPQVALDGASHRYFAIRTDIQGRPGIVLAHKARWQSDGVRLAGERHFYISHFFDGALSLAVSVPVREGTLFAMIERVWVDGYSGLARVKHAVGQRILKRQLLGNIEERRACLAAP